MNINELTRLTDKDLITSILNNYFIVDYGYINKVNPDKTVNITHAIKPTLMNGEELPETTTDNVEVLTLCGSGFSIQLDYKAKDKVLILGLKDYIKSVKDVEKAETAKAFIHYNRSTIKVIPLCIFSDEAKVKIVCNDGKMTIKTEDKLLLDGNNFGGLTKTPELKNQLDVMSTRIDTIISALTNSQTVPQDGGAAYKAQISAAISNLPKEDFSQIESNKVYHGDGN